MVNSTVASIEIVLAAIAASVFIFVLRGPKGAPKPSALQCAVLLLAALQIMTGIYLLAADPLLLIYGYFHWLILLTYVGMLSILAAAFYIGKHYRFSAVIIGIVSLIMSILMSADLAFNLPFSYFYSPSSGIGMSYLLGFGRTALSSFGVSFSFIFLLVASVLTFLISFYIMRRSA